MTHNLELVSSITVCGSTFYFTFPSAIFSCGILDLQVCPGYNTQLYRVVRLHSWSSDGGESRFHYHYYQVHFEGIMFEIILNYSYTLVLQPLILQYWSVYLLKIIVKSSNTLDLETDIATKYQVFTCLKWLH